jgi:integrase
MASLRKLPSGLWRAEVFRQGVRTSRAFHTKAQAQAWATTTEHEILSKARGQIIRRSLRDAFDRYKLTATRRDAVRAEHLAQSMPFADKWLEDVAPADFAAWRDRQLLGVKASTVNRDLNLVQGMLTKCVREWGWLHKSPLAGFKRPRDPAPRQRVISWREVRAMLRALDWHRAPPQTLQQEVGFAFLLALHTGMRASEVLAFERRGTVAHLKTTKNGDARDVPLSSRALRLIDLCGRLMVSASSLDALFRKARRRAGLAGFTFHDARATALTRMSRRVDVLTLARISGHRDIGTLARVYYRVTPQQIAASLR